MDEFNTYFADVRKSHYQRTQYNPHGDNQPPPHGPTDAPNATDLSLSTQTVILSTKNLNDTNSGGSDGIPLEFVRDGLCVLAFYLTCIANTSVVIGEFPDAWKHAVVVPILKKGDPDNVSNYRLIALLPIISKVLEKVTANQLTLYLAEKIAFQTANMASGLGCPPRRHSL